MYQFFLLSFISFSSCQRAKLLVGYHQIEYLLILVVLRLKVDKQSLKATYIEF